MTLYTNDVEYLRKLKCRRLAPKISTKSDIWVYIDPRPLFNATCFECLDVSTTRRHYMLDSN